MWNLYAGLTFQRTYFAKQKAANKTNWETTNVTLDSTIKSLYEDSINFSSNPYLTNDFIFSYCTSVDSVDFEDIVILRIESYILLSDIENAIKEFEQNEFECALEITTDTIVECLCAVANDGICPFEQE